MLIAEKKKYRALKKLFKSNNTNAFPKISSDDDIVFVSDIPKDKALQLLKKACHDVSNFHPEYMEKAVKWSDDQIFGVFNKHDKRNVLAIASVSYNGDESGAAYLHEMTGFIKGGYGKKLVMWLLQKFKKVYGQIALEGSGTKDDPYRPNEKLRDRFYATIPGLKIYRVENSVWDCPADFFYYGISDGSIKEFLEKTYGSKESLDEVDAQYKPPYTLEQIKANYPEHIYSKLANDPIHKWRAETGIELIHKEPTEEELDRIWKNWQLMPQHLKNISDKKSIELFGCNNREHYKQLKNLYEINEINEEDITNNDIYLANMSKSFDDKAWFLKYVPKDIDMIVDFGGGSGEFVEYIQNKLNDSIKYVVIDNNDSFLSQAQNKGYECFKSLQDLKNAKRNDLSNALLILSSVIHEIYSYADEFYDDVGVFWSDVKKCNFRCIAIRDMSYDEKAMNNAPIDAILWVYQNILKSQTIRFKGIPFKEITNSFEEVWGSICDLKTRKVDTKRLFHFLIKYRYQENWTREIQENYLPVSQEKLAKWLISFMQYSFKHKESSKLKFYHDCWAKDLKLKTPDNNSYKKQFLNWLRTLNTHIKWFLQKDSSMKKDLNENKNTYIAKYRNKPDVNVIVDMFWAIRNRLSAPQNDIDWWIKKPFSDLKNFVKNFDTSNKRQRRDANYKHQAIDNGAKLLDTKDGYEIWYVPTYDAMVAIGRFYKGRSAKWCVASDDPDFWFDSHEDSEFVVLVREHPKNDEFDKVAIEMMNHGRYYNEDDIIPWDLENDDWTFDRGVIDNSEELIHYAWQLFKDNSETREDYFG